MSLSPQYPSHFPPVSITIHVDERLFVKDPNSSDLGKRIIRASIEMISRIGFEAFTFKKLAQHINTTEPSVYRYFENKHKLLLYLLNWYWNWMDYILQMSTANIDEPRERLVVALKVLSQPIQKDANFQHVDETALYQIVVVESSKVYLIKEVDKVNKEGLFQGYKRMCERVASIIREVNPDYKYPKALVSTVVESSHDQKFFAEHLPSLTDISKDRLDNATTFLTELVMSAIARGVRN
jgi:DNA-binding transcriptional regulator YbjK